MRVGSTNRPADRALVEELRRFARGESFDEQPLPGLDSEALDFRGGHAPVWPGPGASFSGCLDPGWPVSGQRQEPHPGPRRVGSYPVHAIEEAIEFVQKHALHGAEIGAVRRKGRWCCYDYEDLLKRDKLSLDLFWIKDRSLTDTAALPAPGVVAAEIADDLMTALEQFTKIADRLK